MNRPTLERIVSLLPEQADLRPFRSLVLSTSVADEERGWTGSASLSTWAARHVDPVRLGARLADVVREEQRHVEHTFTALAAVARAVGDGDPQAAAEGLLGLAATEEGRDRPDLAESYARAACDVLDHRHSALAALALRRRARALRALGRHPEAERAYSRSSDVASGLGDLRGAAEAAIGAGNTLEDQGRWSEAQAWYERALEHVAPLEAPVPEQWHAQLNLHVVLRSTGALAESRPLLDAAARTAELLGDGGAAQHIENARGQLAMAEGDIASAITHFRDAEMATTVAFGAVVIRANLAEALLAAGRTVEAAEAARKAEVAAISAGLHTKLPEVYRVLGRIAASEGNPDALVLFERALDTIRSHGLPELERAITLQTYADAEARVGERETAAALRREADDIYRTLGIERGRSEWSDTFEIDGERNTDEVD